MNVYLVVEGLVCEKRVYSHWVPLTNPSLSVVSNIDEVTNNSVLIMAGGGYPSYFDVIEAGVKDVAGNSAFDRLVVAIDSEEMTFDDKYSEIKEFIDCLGHQIKYKIVVQHFCLETWALGNKAIVTRHPKDPKLREYRKLFDVLRDDPENLPPNTAEDLNRSQFSERYLRRLLNEKNKNLSYSKKNPKVLLHEKYYKRVRHRFEKVGHINSFGGFIEAFS